MSIRVALHHKTEYRYDRLVQLGPQVVRLRPAPHSRTPIHSHSLRIEPSDHFLNWQQDPQGNFLARLVFPNRTRKFSVEVDLVADMTVINPFDFFLEPYAELFPFSYEEAQTVELRPFLETSAARGDKFEKYLRTVDTRQRKTIDFLVDINRKLQHDISYLIRMEPGVQTPEETLARGSGSCRDSAWLLIALLRRLGLASRFVSGYLIQLKPDMKPLEGPAGAAQDFTDLHAWTEVYLPGAGWVGLDPTSGLLAGEGHVPLAATPEPDSAAPVSGIVSECQVEFHHEMTITRIHEDPRVTKPYTEEEWTQIQVLGEQVDRTLLANDVRLTMGGEPTFVSIDDVDGDEWNTAAMGPNKRRLAGDLMARLRNRFAPGGLLHFGQGKWYPGESLPRWAFTCYWRTDGVALWNDTRWVADPERDYGFTPAHAQQFAEAFARRLAVDPEAVIAAYEDPYEYIHKEGLLPVNVDPLDNKLDDVEERERVRRAFSRGIDTPVGFVLPIHRVNFKDSAGKDGRMWQTGLWMLRARRIFLIPGDSPAGLRLPIPSLPWEPVRKRQQIWTVDPLAPRGALPVPQRTLAQPTAPDGRQRVSEQALRSSSSASGEPVIRTAFAVEERGGRIHVFMPPLESADDYVEMVAAVEDTAAHLLMPVILEGYTPPFDSRLNQVKVTPDPGVIEVNVHPTATWKDLVDNTTVLYAEARQSRLSTEKFMLDGRHTGTGGGNHLVLGGPTPADSPFLRRPDLLKSFLTFWLNHPALSYLFSGVFIGPTSQAPRVDETRADAIYELEIAMDLLRDQKGACPPWLVDRIFRNLLVDVTGNTHRAEFCIDKLYSPDSSTGRLGLVEMRAFEMPPHERMSLTQQLLVRSLVAHFWQNPYEQKPIRWGTRLHDQFLLPYFVEWDLGKAIGEIRRAGYAFEPSWFAPQMEFRFPVYGRVTYEGIQVELRQAIEPWDVLGEEPGGGGTVRFVDSSVERLQVYVKGLIGERYQIVCNGRRLPLQQANVAGEYVCGVRYRAWQPPNCLHPTIPVHTPLIFDVVDVAAGRSIGGCSYHAKHPGGRSYETFPVNANEAESRRVSRFFPFGHTPGPMTLPPLHVDPEFPATLDLRKPPRMF